jgi:hypothetical protein
MVVQQQWVIHFNVYGNMYEYLNVDESDTERMGNFVCEQYQTDLSKETADKI